MQFFLQDIDQVQGYELYCAYLLREYHGSKKQLKVGDYV